jgi:hypothetical protein
LESKGPNKPGFATIRVTGSPPGEIPAWVRDAWIGCVFVTENETDDVTLVSEEMKQFLDEVMAKESTVYLVRQDRAMEILRKKMPAAAEWYRDHLQAPRIGALFAFPSNEVVVVSKSG